MLSARVEMAEEVCRGGIPPDELLGGQYPRPRDPEPLIVTLENQGEQRFRGAVRAVLLPDTEAAGEHATSAPEVSLAPGETQTIRLPIRVKHTFPCDGQRFLSYRSAPFTAEVCWESNSVLLSAAVKVR
jgi:hypothetical protein